MDKYLEILSESGSDPELITFINGITANYKAAVDSVKMEYTVCWGNRQWPG